MEEKEKRSKKKGEETLKRGTGKEGQRRRNWKEFHG
jgi:hypothetical protein